MLVYKFLVTLTTLTFTQASILNLLGLTPATGLSLGEEALKLVNQHDQSHRGHRDHRKGKEVIGDNAVHGAFVDHFSPSIPNTEVYLQSTISKLYPNQTVTVTQDYTFNLLGFAASSENSDKIILRELEDLESISKIVYISPRRRRDGKGTLIQSVSLGGWRVGWGDDEVIVIIATWADGFARFAQWHLISDNPKASQSLIYDVVQWSRQVKNAILVFDQGWWQPDTDLWRSVQGASWDDVILEHEFKTRLQKDYRSFYKSEKTYKDLQVPWKRGLILLGPPGNGKTISLKAIMNDVKVPILYVKSFRTYMGDEAGIRAVFQRARAEAPCLLVLEDLDALINDMNRSFFLNEVDGIEDNDGLLLIGTTNHFDRLDPALSSRPSRFDRKYDFPNPTQDERRQYAVYWQNKLKSNKDIEFSDELVDQVAEKTDKFSFAYLKEVFVSSLLTLAGLDDPSSAPPFSEIVLDQIKKLREQLEEGKDMISLEGSARNGKYSDKISKEDYFDYVSEMEMAQGGGGGYGDIIGGNQGPGEAKPVFLSENGDLVDLAFDEDRIAKMIREMEDKRFAEMRGMGGDDGSPRIEIEL